MKDYRILNSTFQKSSMWKKEWAQASIQYNQSLKDLYKEHSLSGIQDILQAFQFAQGKRQPSTIHTQH